MSDDLNTPADALKKLGTFLANKLGNYKTERKTAELQMMKDLRQYRATYDPEVESKLDAKRSKTYPRDTRLKLIGFTAKMMEMMFPASEKNYAVKPQEYPDLSREDIDNVITGLEQQRLAEAQGGEPVPLTSEDILDGVKSLANERAQNMENLIEDQLTEQELEYPVLCKKVVRSGGLYGWGVAEGPMTGYTEEKVWEQDETTGAWRAVTKKTPVPVFEPCRSWDLYPDMTAKTWRQQEGLFKRYIFSRHDLSALTTREDFFGDVIKEYLRTHDSGNFKPDSYETELRLLEKTADLKHDGRHYEVFRYFGFVSAKQIAAIGVEIPESEMHKDMLVDAWLIDDQIIKAEKAAFGADVGDMFHAYFYDDEDEAGLLGVSLPQAIRDSQMKLCSIDRMTMDNASATCGPITEIDESRLSRKQRESGVEIGAFATIYTDSSLDPQNNNPIVRDIQIDSHITELIALRERFQQQLDMESNIQSWTMGNAQPLGEAFRTSQNMSQMTGGANMVTKDQVRAFDRFTASVIGSIVKWNMQFLAPLRPEIRGDHKVIARGNISLVAKEIRGAALDQFMQTLTAEERAIIKTRDTLLERLKSRDLPVDIVEDAVTAAKILDQMRQAQADAAMRQNNSIDAKTQKDQAAAQKAQAETQEILQTVEYKINELVAKATATLAKGKGIKDANQINTIKLLLEQITGAAREGVNAAQRTTKQ